MSPIRQLSPGSVAGASTQPACKRCYQRKKKCDRVTPRCSNCERSELECVYESPVLDKNQKILLSRLETENIVQRQQIQSLQQQLEALQTKPLPIIPVAPAPPILHQPIAGDITPNTASIFFDLSKPTIAERIISKLFNTEIDLQSTARTLVANVAHQFQLTMPLSAADADITTYHADQPTPSTSYRPTRQEAERMVDTYFEFGSCFYPVVDPSVVTQDMTYVYADSDEPSPFATSPIQPDVRVYRLFTILAIGNSLMPKSPANPDTAALRACALAHFPAALRSDDETCLACIVLFCIYSMTDSAPMDPYQTVGLAARLAAELGYLSDDETLPWDTREMRKRIFWSVYGMDRSISFTLRRPLAIREDTIRISLPTSVPDCPGTHRTLLTPITLFRETVKLRRLQGVISAELNPGVHPTSAEPTATITRIRNEIDAWFDELPTSTTPSSYGRKHPYLEVNYYLLIVRLYSPSSIMPRPSQSGMTTLRHSAHRVIEMYGAGSGGYRMRQNFVTLCHIILACCALVYTLKEGEGDAANLGLRTWKRTALHQLEASEKLLVNFCSHVAYAEQYIKSYGRLTQDLKATLKHSTFQQVYSDDFSTNVQVPVLPSPGTSLHGQIWNPSGAGGLDGFDFGNDYSVDELLATFGIGSFPA